MVNAQLTEDQQAELAMLENLPQYQINTTDIPEVLNWTNAKRGVFYRCVPPKPP